MTVTPTATTTTTESLYIYPSLIQMDFNDSFYLQHPVDIFSWAYMRPRKLRCPGQFLIFTADLVLPVCCHSLE